MTNFVRSVVHSRGAVRVGLRGAGRTEPEPRRAPHICVCRQRPRRETQFIDPMPEDDAPTPTNTPILSLPVSSSKKLADKISADWQWLSGAYTNTFSGSEKAFHDNVVKTRSRVQAVVASVSDVRTATEASVTQLTSVRTRRNTIRPAPAPNVLGRPNLSTATRPHTPSTTRPALVHPSC